MFNFFKREPEISMVLLAALAAIGYVCMALKIG